MWARTDGLFVPKRDLSELVPEGLNDRSQAIYCLGFVKKLIRPVGNGVIRLPMRY
jgi:hypothetical protein